MVAVLLLLLVSSLSASSSSDDDDPYNHLPGIGDALWLRYPLISSLARRAEYRQLIGPRAAVVCRESGGGCTTNVVKLQLDAAAEELRTGLTGLLGEQIKVSVGDTAAGARLVASVLPAQVAALGTEGFRISQVNGTVHVDAASSSGLLYGVFRLLATMQQHSPLPTNYTSKPAMERRVWELWDVRYMNSWILRACHKFSLHGCSYSLHINYRSTGTRWISHPRLRWEVLAVATRAVP
eukprot:COSAG02_NODE_5_length_66751_cov_63.939148_20_plen_238_part_00